MSDGYELFCFQKIEESIQAMFRISAFQADDITCACADYLQMEGYMDASAPLTARQAIAEAAHIIPTTNNQTS